MGIQQINIHGKYYGNNHTISGIYINNSSDYQGLFGKCTTAEIKDLGIVNSYISGKSYIGGIVGDIRGDSKNNYYISNCYSESIVKGTSYVGGIIGEGNYIIVDNCYNGGYIYGNGNNGSIGGIAGSTNADVTNSYNEGFIVGTSSYIGGIVGRYGTSNNKSISNCYNSGSVKGERITGGIAGEGGSGSDKGSIIKSYNIGSVTGTESVGGITGRNSCSIQECYNAGDVTGDTLIGGITGNHWYKYTNTQYTYNVGRVTGNAKDTRVGGIIGSLTEGNIYYSYNAGNVTANTTMDYANVGGIAGYQGSSSTNPYINYCYNLSSSIKTLGSGSWTYCGGIVGDTGYYAYLNNCYNIGDITKSNAQYKGAIAGSIYNYNNSYFYPRNCAYLQGSASIAIGRPAYTPSSDSYKILALSAEEMPDVLSVIGTSCFTEDTTGINNGYPIFKWQAEALE